jgi:nitroimidazol reductase NimA-like FMN-containing flavoprotein (pyridoxamine 5'-phosphate oxidase superfamily)
MARSRTTIRRHPERALAVPEEAERILAEALVAHVGIVQDGQPFVIPFTFLYRDRSLYLHGAHGSRTVKALASGAPVCVEVTLVDGLIASKSAETHSVNYQSVVLFGRGRPVRGEARLRELMEALIARYFPGRTAGQDYAHITEPEMKATMLVEVEIEEMSAKGRFGGPRGPFDDDPDAPGNAGVHPIRRHHT